MKEIRPRVANYMCDLINDPSWSGYATKSAYDAALVEILECLESAPNAIWEDIHGVLKFEGDDSERLLGVLEYLVDAINEYKAAYKKLKEAVFNIAYPG